LHAAGQLKLPPETCIYLGDDLRDMKAAHAAGMRPIAVEWGYHHPDSGGPDTWEAAAILAHPLDLMRHL
jgi:phosphoglycolate phosphatase